MKKKPQAQPIEETDLHKMVSSLWDMQNTRFKIENRLRGTKDNRLLGFLQNLSGKGSAEDDLKGEIKTEVTKCPIHKWIISQRGLSYDLAGQLIGLIQDIKKFDNVSKLWAYFGLSVVDVCLICKKRYYPHEKKAEKIIALAKRLKDQNEKKIVKEKKTDEDFVAEAKNNFCNCDNPDLKRSSQRKIKGTMIDYNPQAKVVAYKVGVQFIKQGDLYRKLYDRFRAEYEMREDLKTEINSKKGKKTKLGESKGTAHIHAMAQRKMIKIFLQHLWINWRELEGLSTNMPYVIDIGGHSDYIQPSDK